MYLQYQSYIILGVSTGEGGRMVHFKLCLSLIENHSNGSERVDIFLLHLLGRYKCESKLGRMDVYRRCEMAVYVEYHHFFVWKRGIKKKKVKSYFFNSFSGKKKTALHVKRGKKKKKNLQLHWNLFLYFNVAFPNLTTFIQPVKCFETKFLLAGLVSPRDGFKPRNKKRKELFK